MNYLKTHKLHVSFVIILLCFFSEWRTQLLSQGTIIDHTCTEITSIPESAINQAKAMLHIGYGHTSHGSQITTGMTGLITFANSGGLGLSHPQDIFQWNNGGTAGALDLEEGDGYGTGWLDHDCGYYPDWVNETRTYLDDPIHSDVNVIIWSWCGQVSSRTEQQIIDTYLSPMSQLESDYPNVSFVYMTGHADGTGESGNLHLRNQQIKNYCITNNKVLYDFYDIECYDPDDNYFGDRNVSDDCSYTGGNWAIEWQNSHTEGVDWYNCLSAHSQPLNANRKAYAAWSMFAKLAEYDDPLPVEMISFDGVRNKNSITIQWRTASEIGCLGFHVWRKAENADSFSRITVDSDLILGHGNSSAENKYSFIDYNVKEFISYTYKIEELTINGESNFYGLIVVDRTISFFDLKQNYPNPFNPATTIEYQIDKTSHADLSIYNIIGQKVATLVSEKQPTGSYKTEWNATGFPGGIYFYRLETDKGNIQTRKLILLK